jgi:hypothetical protein
MLAVFYWPVTLVNNQEISRNGFLKNLTCSLVISSGMAAGFSKNSGKRSKSLSCSFKNSLQSKFTFEGERWLWESRHLTKYLRKKNDERMVLDWNYLLSW